MQVVNVSSGYHNFFIDDDPFKFAKLFDNIKLILRMQVKPLSSLQIIAIEIVNANISKFIDDNE